MPIDENYRNMLLKTPIAMNTDVFTSLGKSYYVDKTLLVKDILDNNSQAILLTRPRRFGKSLNMSMLKTFFELPLVDGQPALETSHYFRNLKIWQCGSEYQAEQGKRPVISISFNRTKSRTLPDTIAAIKGMMFNELSRHIEIMDSPKLNFAEREQASVLFTKISDYGVLCSSLKTLCDLLYKHHGIKPMILIDEYDMPIQAAWQSHDEEFYEGMVSFMRSFLTGALKSSESLYKAILTGVTRVSKESIFSGLNNITVNTVMDTAYSRYFGFTQEEIEEMFRHYGIEDKLPEAEEWYDGYKFGNTKIYNPWSVLSYISSDCVARPYWANTSDNRLAGDVLQSIGEEDAARLEDFVKGGTEKRIIDTNIIYPEIEGDENAAYSLLLQAGYLKCINSEVVDGNEVCEIKIPNREINRVYLKEIVNRFLKNKKAISKASLFTVAILTRDADGLQKTLQKLLLNVCSFFDLTEEKDYQNFMLGLMAATIDGYDIKGNREAGLGRADIKLTPLINDKNARKMPGIIFEIKHHRATEEERNDSKLLEQALQNEAEEALRQIDKMRYVEDLKSAGCTTILKYGAAFSGKVAKVFSN